MGIGATLRALAAQPKLAFLCMLLEAQLRSGELAPTFDWEARFLTLSEVNERLGFSVKQGECLLASGKPTLFPDEGVPQKVWSPVWLDARELARFQAERQTFLTLETVATQLGLMMREVNELRIWQCLSAASGPTVDGFADWRFAPAAVDECKQHWSAQSQVSQQTEADWGDWLDGAEIRLHLECYRLSLGEWVCAVLAGECPFGLVLGQAVSLSACRFALASIARYLAQHDAPPLLPLAQRVNKSPRPFSLSVAVARLERCWEQAQCRYTRTEAGGMDAQSLHRIAQQLLQKAAATDRPEAKS